MTEAIRWIGAALLVVAGSQSALAAQRQFDLEDPMGRNSVALTMESRYQPIRGIAEQVRGTLAFDPETGACSGTIDLATSGVHWVGDNLDEDLSGSAWFDSANRPNWPITIKTAAHAEALDDETWQIAALGAMVVRGRAGGVNFPVTITYIPGGMTERTEGAVTGDLIVVRGGLSFARSDYGLDPASVGGDLYGDEIELNFSLVGWSAGN
ncbi:MAG: YceI family protein [Candidatus Eisenbacteria bacterium]